MADNILKKQLECIGEDFLRGVFGRVGMPMWRALTHMFGAVMTGKSTLATDFLRKAKGFKKVLKHLSDNLEAVSMKTHALLAGIRALVNEAKLRFIS